MTNDLPTGEHTTLAWQLAKEDAELILNFTGSPVGITERVLLVDGSQYSPSWRALPGGKRVWELEDFNAQMEYEHELDLRLDLGPVSQAIGTDGFYLYWEDGCLWLSHEDLPGDRA